MVTENFTSIMIKKKICLVHRADTNHDGYLEHLELKNWITTKVQEHLDDAIAENERIFKHLDADKDGLLL